jgi:CHAT domain-containing protein
MSRWLRSPLPLLSSLFLLALAPALLPVTAADPPAGAQFASPCAPRQRSPQCPESVWLELQGQRQLEQGQYLQAIQSFQQARQLYKAAGHTSNVASIDLSLAKAYLLKGDYAQALPGFQQALAAARQDGFGTERPLSLLGMTYYQMGKLPEAEQVLREAIASWEKLRSRPTNSDAEKITLADQLLYAYRLLQKVLVAQNQTDAALEIAELGRARALVELLSDRGNSKTAAPNLGQLRQIAQTQNATLVQYSIVGREMRVLNIEPRDETNLYIWVIPPRGPIAFRQVDLKAAGVGSLRELVLQTRQDALGVRGRSSAKAPQPILRGNQPGAEFSQLQQLHRLLIQPIADRLPTNPTDRVIFVPEGSLLLVPFAALQDRSRKYLIEQHTLSISPSIQVLALTHQQRRASPDLLSNPLIVGNPTMPSLAFQPGEAPEPLPELPGAEQEAKAIATLLKSGVLIGNQASKRAVLRSMPQARLIHLATHGLLDLDANLNEFGQTLTQPVKTARSSGVFLGAGVILGPGVTINGVSSTIAAAREGVNLVQMPGAIALAPTQGDTGFLTAKEILNLKLTANLVVLSACDTGRGRITGDGMVGLSRAFIAAGVPSVIVSLWAVPDAPTAALMTEFYTTLRTQPNKAQALRQAMLSTLKQYPNPRDWAAFTLIGEAE